MKKITALLLCFLLLFSFCACAKDHQIEGKTWELLYVLESVDGEETVTYACEAYLAVSQYAGDPPVSLSATLKARGGKLTLTDHTNEKKYVASYESEELSPDATEYFVRFSDKKGQGLVVCSYADDGTVYPSMSISVDKYTLIFSPK